MQLSELKLISASNLIRLRTEAGLTQAELGAKLNYSDKSISKWERGEAIPDAYVLTQMAELFGVTVDYLLTSHDKWEAPETEEAQMKKPVYSEARIIALVVVSVWTAFLTAFVALCLFDIIWWEIFLIALFTSLLVLLILLARFKRRKYLELCTGVLILSILLLLLVALPNAKLWHFLVLSVPAELIVFLAFNIRKKTAQPEQKTPETAPRGEASVNN